LNTRAVAELLGISTSTVQRWVKQLNLNMSRNELGHFIFTDEDIELLKQVQTKLQDGVLLQDINFAKPKRTGTIKENSEKNEILEDKVKRLELSLYQKADSVVSYQILQHRREIEELQETISELTERLAYIEGLVRKEKEIAVTKMDKNSDEIKTPRKKKSFFKAIFGY
jgi:chromosome-anchoring protein RacA